MSARETNLALVSYDTFSLWELVSILTVVPFL